ncbi:restriction endonuclease subunit S [Delftia acidovorans]
MLLSNLDLLAIAPGGVARLREFILTLAVQGKLVPQDPADEPASALVQTIRAEKGRLTAEGKSKRDKPLAEIKEEEKPFELPVGWDWVRLADVVRVLNGRAYGKQELLDTGPVRVLRVGNLFTSKHWYYSDLELESEKYCEEGDLLYAWSASFGPFIWQGPRAIFHYHIWKLEPWAPHCFDVGYFHKFLAEKTAEIKATGHGVSMVHMTKEKMEKIVVPYPPLAEQSRIVTRVEELMRLCDALDAKGKLESTQHAQLVSTLLGSLTSSATPEELADNWQRVAQHFDLLLDRPEAIDALEQTLLQLAVRGLLVPQDPTNETANTLLARIRSEKDHLISEGKIKRDKPLPPISEEEKLFELPVGWEWVRINDLAEVQGGIQKTQLRRPIKLHFPYLRVANVQRDALLLEDMERFELSLEELQRWRLAEGDLLIVEGNGSADEIGRCAVWDGSIDPCVYQNHLIRVRCFQPDCMEFIKLFLNAPSGAEEMKRLAITTSGLYNLSVGKIRNYVVPMPSLAEQSRIVNRVATLRRLCTDLRHRLTAAQATQSHLAQALVESSNFL